MKESQLVNYAIRRCYMERTWLTVGRANSGKVKTIDERTGKKRWVTLNKPGTPDLQGFFGPIGRYIGIECKVGKNDQTPYQEEFERDAVSKGALYALIRTPEELESLIEKLKPGAPIQ